MSDKLKSAYELAMERLRAQDREHGIERKPLTAEQKKEIAELRRQAQAKRAELEILREQRLAQAAGDPAKLAEEEQKHETDLRRVESWLESAIAKVKQAGAGSS